MTPLRCLLALWLSVAALAEAAPFSLSLQPLGRVPTDLLTTVRTALERHYGVEVELLPAHEPSRAAYYPPRSRWRAPVLLETLQAAEPEPSRRRVVLALIDADIEAEVRDRPHWGVFGLAFQGRGVAVASPYRLRRGADRDRLRTRLTKVAIHEVAHALGEPHCPRPDCVLTDLEGAIKKLDAAPTAFCPDTAVRLRRLGVPL